MAPSSPPPPPPEPTPADALAYACIVASEKHDPEINKQARYLDKLRHDLGDTKFLKLMELMNDHCNNITTSMANLKERVAPLLNDNDDSHKSFNKFMGTLAINVARLAREDALAKSNHDVLEFDDKIDQMTKISKEIRKIKKIVIKLQEHNQSNKRGPLDKYLKGSQIRLIYKILPGTSKLDIQSNPLPTIMRLQEVLKEEKQHKHSLNNVIEPHLIAGIVARARKEKVSR